MKESGSVTIGKRKAGLDYPVYVVAEMSGNHHQKFEAAVEIVHAARSSGADAIKLQTAKPETLTIRSEENLFRVHGGTLWDGRSLYDLYEEVCTPWEWQPKLKAIADDIGIELFSSAFDATAVDFLEEMNVPVYKVASFEIVDIPLIQKMAQTGKPLIMSTGMATFEEIEEAVNAARGAGAKEIALLKCTSAYPAPAQDMNLRTIPDLAARFNLPVGLSDHTLGIAVPVAAVALGACIIEKHFTLSRSVSGPDSAFSLEPHEFKSMVDAIRVAEQALGSVHYGGTAEEEKSRPFRRSLFVVKDIEVGEIFTTENVRSIRPGNGLHPRYLNKILGSRASKVIKKGTPLDWSLIE